MAQTPSASGLFRSQEIEILYRKVNRSPQKMLRVYRYFRSLGVEWRKAVELSTEPDYLPVKVRKAKQLTAKESKVLTQFEDFFDRKK